MQFRNEFVRNIREIVIVKKKKNFKHVSKITQFVPCTRA